MLELIKKNRLLSINATIGFFAAESIGDDIRIFESDKRDNTLGTACFLRQQMLKAPNEPYLCLSDLVAPKESKTKDYFGLFTVTAGIGVDEASERFVKDNDDYSAILLKALATRLAEAMSEALHERVRRELWGYAKEERLTPDDLLNERYRGIRPAPGYPACPDHTEKELIFRLLGAQKNAGVRLTENYAMDPLASTCGYYFAHPAAKYFAVGKIGKDQVENYAKRKKMSVKNIERWLAPNLNY